MERSRQTNVSFNKMYEYTSYCSSALDWSRSGQFLMTGSADSTVAIWNVLDTSIYVDRFHYGKTITNIYQLIHLVGASVNPPEAMFNPRFVAKVIELICVNLGTKTNFWF
jgi:WD40 repeat protein